MTQDDYPDQAQRRQLCEAAVTLDGYPARISGTARRFATVSWRDGPGGAEFAWPTVARIVEAGGNFRS